MLVNEESNVLSLMHLMSNFAFVFLQKLDDEGPRIIVVIRVLIEIWRYRVVKKKVSFGIFSIIKTTYDIEFFTVKTTGKILSLSKF